MENKINNMEKRKCEHHKHPAHWGENSWICANCGTKYKSKITKIGKKLKSIEEHEEEFWKEYKSEPHDTKLPSGIACPKCGTELLMSTQVSIATRPPKVPVCCPRCGYQSAVH